MIHQDAAPLSGESTTTTTTSHPATTNNNDDNHNHDDNQLVVILAGPTGTGKSDVAARLCSGSRKGGLIVSADSVQAYRGVMIGANKPPAEERLETPHILVDVVDPHDHDDNSNNTTPNDYNAAEWQRDALHVISKLLQRPKVEEDDDDDDGNRDKDSSTPTTTTTTTVMDDRARRYRRRRRREIIDQSIADAMKLKGYSPPVMPVVVGGTMMYLQWLVHGRPDAAKPSPEAVQQAANELATFRTTTNNSDWEGAVNHVASHGPIFAQRLTGLCGKDWYRLRRTLEIALTVQQEQQQKRQERREKQEAKENNSDDDDDDREQWIQRLFTGQREGSLESYGYDVRCFFLCPDDRMKHTELVDERCEVMITRGLLTETTNLRLAGQLPDMAARAIGYRQTLDYFEREGAKDNDEDAFMEYLNQFTTATRRYSKKQMQWFRKDGTFVFVPVAVAEPKEKRVNDAAQAIEDLLSLSREEFNRQCFSDDSISAQTMKKNEAQGKGMKFYQFKSYILKPGTPELEKAIAEADRNTNQIQAKKPRPS